MTKLSNRRTASSAAGFTLIELLIVVAIIGIIAAIAIPNLLNAVDKGKQKRSMSDLRTVCAAMEAYATDTAAYPKNASNWAVLKPWIDPYFIRQPPDADGWSNGWDGATDANGLNYTVASYGKDGLTSPRGGGMTSDFNCDILFVNGRFFQWPEGSQT